MLPCRRSAAVRSAKPIFPPWRTCLAAVSRTAAPLLAERIAPADGPEPPRGIAEIWLPSGNRRHPVGAILLIFSTMREGDQSATRCNLSSWYVEPAYRTYATLLVSQALRHGTSPTSTYRRRRTPGRSSRRRVSRAIATAFSSPCRPCKDCSTVQNVKVFDAAHEPAVAFDPFDREILSRHAEHGCISLWCATAERAYPFVFRAAAGEKLPALRADDLLRRHRRLRPLRRTDRPIPRPARQTIRHCRFQ